MTQGSRVRHRDPKQFEIYGIMQVLNVKNGFVTCYVGDPFQSKLEQFEYESLMLA